MSKPVTLTVHWTYLDIGEVVFSLDHDQTVAILPAPDDAVGELIARAPELRDLCKAAFHALRSYEFGNASPDLAKSIADKIEPALAALES